MWAEAQIRKSQKIVLNFSVNSSWFAFDKPKG